VGSNSFAITRTTYAPCFSAIWIITAGTNEPGLTRATYASYISELWNNNTEPDSTTQSGTHTTTTCQLIRLNEGRLIHYLYPKTVEPRL